ncbi:pectinesterase [Lacibacter cauensis]|uniref:Pectinesterase n=1 Tax=Lacibacter cauensis TaxID=510947 RepID=A0A562SQ45_9BACT|nr:alpha/beta hydrolase [Lacibacter cauensis]TWI83308.1 pectinesterase [Lacibacter cauensis]
MKRLFYIVHGLLFCMAANAQTVNGITNVPDTSFNLTKEKEKVKKQYPFIVLPADERSAFIEEIKGINYYKPTNRFLQLDAFFPKQNKGHKKLHPAIIIIHGGGWRSGNRTQHHALAFALAGKGYACFTPEYRLSTEAFYPAAVQDIKAAVQWIKTKGATYAVDTTKIVVMGFSAGGQLAALVGNTNGYQPFEPLTNLKASTNVQAIVDVDGTLSFIHPQSSETKPSPTIGASEYWLGYNTTENPELWKEASPLSHAGANSLPTLFLNSSVERMHAGREDYISILQQHKIYTEVHTFENSPHSFCLFEPWFTPTVNYITSFLQNIFPDAQH